MKLLERDSKTKLFVPVAKICTSHFEEEYIYIGVENILI